MLNPFVYLPRANVFTNYYFMHDTTGTIPNMYQFVSGNVYSTRLGIFFDNRSNVITSTTIPVDFTRCSIDYTINCSSLSSVTVNVFSTPTNLFIHPVSDGRLKVFNNFYCATGTIQPRVPARIGYTSDGANFSVFLNGTQVGGPTSLSGLATVGPQNAGLSIATGQQSNAYIDFFRISNLPPPQTRIALTDPRPPQSPEVTFNLVGTASNSITKRLFTTYTDNASFDPDGYRIGVSSPTTVDTNWTGWANLTGFSSLFIASPSGRMVVAAGTTDGVSTQIIGNLPGPSTSGSTFSFTRRSNTYVPISIYARATSGLSVKLNNATPVKWGTIQPVQFPERFKIIGGNGVSLKVSGVDVILRANTTNTQYSTRLEDVTTGRFLRSDPLSLQPVVNFTSNNFLWTFTSNTITSNNGVTVVSDYRFA